MPLVINSRVTGHRRSRAFTLVELMVVIALASTLAALLLPALAGAKEKSRRTVCKSNMSQFWHACFIYADDNGQMLPSSSDNNGHPQTIYLSNTTYSNVMDYIGHDSRILSCPNIVVGSQTNYPSYTPSIGHLIGYNYLGEMDPSLIAAAKGVDFWVPTKSTLDSPTNTILADANYWNQTGDRLKIAPHGASGGIVVNNTSFTVGLRGTKSADIGAQGGNVALLDGSINWKLIKNMGNYLASSSDDQYFGNW
jgi:prepilin-type N-terminal cleavage/methylation domain-containing protein